MAPATHTRQAGGGAQHPPSGPSQKRARGKLNMGDHLFSESFVVFSWDVVSLFLVLLSEFVFEFFLGSRFRKVLLFLAFRLFFKGQEQYRRFKSSSR